MRYFFVQILFISVCGIACKSANVLESGSISDGIQFESPKKFEDALIRARSDNKLVFVEFYADWCAPCKLMEQEVFSDKNIGEYFNKHFINVKVDTEGKNGPDVAGIFQVNGMPTLLFLDGFGSVIERIEGAVFQEELINFAENALAQKSTSNEQKDKP